MRKRPISLTTLRRIPSQFSWVDQRLVQERSIDQLSHAACARSLFLVTVADAQGLSFYSEPSLGQRLSLTPLALRQARHTLIPCQLLAYDPPLYQVLALDQDPPSPRVPSPRMTTADTPIAIKDIFQHLAETLS